MVPNASDLARRRLTMVAVVRTIALLFVVVMLVPVTVMLSVYAVERDIELLIAAFVMIAGAGIVGAVLWLSATKLGALMMPTPRAHACPRCGYDLRSITEPRCPECGTVLTREFMPGHVADGASASVQGRALLLQLVAIAIGRAVGVIGILGFGLGLVTLIIELIFTPPSRNSMDIIYNTIWFVCLGIVIALFAIPIVMPRRFSRWMVPIGRFDPGSGSDRPEASVDDT